MQANFRPHRLVRAKTFILAAASYWLTVYPRICIQSRHWSHRAREIPDPILRDLALQAKRVKRGNVEGSAAFAAFSPGPQRAAVIQAQVAFQCAYDYLDTLAEQADTPAPEANALQLHQALLVALDPQRTHLDYYAFQQHKEDAGYLTEIVDTCRRALDRLPSRQTIAAAALRFGDRIVAYQSRNLTEAQGGHRQLCRWATAVTRRDRICAGGRPPPRQAHRSGSLP